MENKKLEHSLTIVKEYIGEQFVKNSNITYSGFDVDDIGDNNHYSYSVCRDSFIISMKIVSGKHKNTSVYKELYNVSETELFDYFPFFEDTVNVILADLEKKLFNKVEKKELTLKE